MDRGIVRMFITNSVAIGLNKNLLQVYRITLPALLLAMIGACSSGENTPGMAGGYNPNHQDGGSNSTGGRNARDSGTGVTSDSGTVSGNCTIGDSKACRVVLGIYNGQESCFVGMQYCDTGTWTSCIDKRDAS